MPSGRCSPGFSQAATADPRRGVRRRPDGRLRAFIAADGKVLWKYDTTIPRDTVNGVKGAPGGTSTWAARRSPAGWSIVHSGYNGNAGANNVLIAFSPEGQVSAGEFEGLAAPARRALAAGGFNSLADLANAREADVARLHGMGSNALKKLRDKLAERGLTFAP